MTKIILDTNIILAQPKVLGLQIPGTKFLIPHDVMAELKVRATQRGAAFDGRIDLVEKASQEGTISIINTHAPAFSKYHDLLNSNKLSSVDLAIIALAIECKEKGETVKVATHDKEICKIAAEYKIEILSELDVADLLRNFKKTDVGIQTVQKAIAKFELLEKRNIWKALLVGAVATSIAFIIYSNLHVIISTINVWGTIIAILILGIGLFVFRERQKLSYGVFEFFVGVVAIIMLFQPEHFNFSTLHFDLDFNIKLLGGLYIMVRGLDNIVIALKDTKAGLMLKNKFRIGS